MSVIDPVADGRCDCCDLPLFSCGKALEARQRKELLSRRARLLARAEYFPAAYGGRCGRCSEPIAPGDPIKSDLSFGSRVYVGGLCCDGDA